MSLRAWDEDSPVKIIAVIPARMASSRFPGKPLLNLGGLPMVEHVRRRVLLCAKFAEVVVATCDSAIASVVKAYGGSVVRTSTSHPGALDRVAEAANYLDCDVKKLGVDLLTLSRPAISSGEMPIIPK